MKNLLTFIYFSLLLAPTWLLAQVVHKPEINFGIETKQLLEGEVHLGLEIMGPKKLRKKYPQLATMDVAGFSRQPQTKMVVVKSAYIVKKEAGFFDHENILDQKFISHIMEEQKVQKSGPHSFKIAVPGEEALKYVMDVFYDSDEISTLPNPKVIRAVTNSRKMDVISQSSTATVFKEFRDYSRYCTGGTQITNIIPLKEKRTLLITYTLIGLKKFYALENLLRQNFTREAVGQKQLIQSFP